MGIVIILLIVVAGLIVSHAMNASQLPIIHSRWHQFYDGMQFSSSGFYTYIEEEIKVRDLPRVAPYIISLTEGGMFSDKRKYLRVPYRNYVFDICAAPYGNGFFVSYWFGEKLHWTDKLPFATLFKVRKSYYQTDTENMFKDCIHHCVLQAIETATQNKGLRLTEEPA